MPGVEMFQRITLEQAARWLELHPFDVVRILVADGSLPPDLRLEAAHVERIRGIGGLQTWWERPPAPESGESPERALVRALLRLMLEHGACEPEVTRADNLFRGLDAEHQQVLRRAVNALIREGCLVSTMTATGLSVAVRDAALADVRAFAEDGRGPVDRLWDQD